MIEVAEIRRMDGQVRCPDCGYGFDTPNHELGCQPQLFEMGLAPSQELERWWVELATSEAAVVAGKMREYGGEGRAIDLVDIGRDLLRAQRVPESEISDEWAAETGVYFYARGKLSRWTAAVIRGERVSDDTLHDLGVYVRMAQRIRVKGGWPQ